MFCTFTVTALGKDNDPNGVTELQSTHKVRCLKGITKGKLTDSGEIRNLAYIRAMFIITEDNYLEIGVSCTGHPRQN